MAETVSTPRVNSRYLDSFTNQTVRLVGKVMQLRGEQAIISSQGNVTAHLNRVRLYLLFHLSLFYSPFWAL
jgi:replication factor A3